MDNQEDQLSHRLLVTYLLL